MAYKTPTSCEEQISILMRQPREHVKHIAMNWYEHWRRETQTAEEAKPIYCVVIEHGILDDSFLSNQSIHYTHYAVSLMMKIRQRNGREELEGTYTDLAKMMGGSAEHPSNESNSTITA
jgi:hypothetical protein